MKLGKKAKRAKKLDQWIDSLIRRDTRAMRTLPLSAEHHFVDINRAHRTTKFKKAFSVRVAKQRAARKRK